MSWSRGEVRRAAADPVWWGAALLIGATLLVLGWGQTYPLTEDPVVAPLFWLGLWLACGSLVGLVWTARSPAVDGLASVVLLLLISAPQWLSLSSGSDAGSLAALVAYRMGSGPLDLTQDVAASSYFQWPGAIVVARLLTELAGGDPYLGAQLVLLIAAPAVGLGLWALLDRPDGGGFWGLATYWTGAYWLLNWQAVPYVVGLALLLALLAALDEPTLGGRLLALLLLAAGLETHPLVGVWLGLVVGLRWLAMSRARPDGRLSVWLLLLILVAQGALLLYKNGRFLVYLVASVGGRHARLEAAGISSRSLGLQVRGAVTFLAEDPAATALKVLSWLALAAAMGAGGLAAAAAARRWRCGRQAVALSVAGAVHLGIGMARAAIGTRAIQLLGVLPAWWIADAAGRSSPVGRAVRMLCALALVLLPAVLMRAHSTGAALVTPAEARLIESLTDLEPVGPLSLLAETHAEWLPGGSLVPLSARQMRYGSIGSCRGPALVVETAGWRREMAPMVRAPELIEGASLLYDNGAIRLRSLGDCSALGIGE
jgi:hypothetical protein